ncbi:YciI family protein [Microbacterium sp. EYE_5]|uniref:YciI family protein n=1 Tax=unclassified Microbacterium TaxID=2609290 RepID=UPI0020043D93|nr:MULTISPECIES: YciI family protein [unclassified Microbacterium]MCK6081726.1 YciI family protein [Microbacterium sp. EYE_382]MCK6086996.1 YciI family protein [Microbacterium sp. EYE_384]MCK6125026.1 YciI family protein [Microbacterium sp. EYE_80]MCK6127759.1 YciI family protein [Microbacterium sp. EYE_79]MCK6142680.1 YciI family protein [Microbacterium sp. EYE_39]
MKHMLIMRATQAAVEHYENMDFGAVINAMGAYNESMMKAGVLVAGEGLAQEPGYVVEFNGETPVVSDGPYGEIHELFNGFWILQTATAEEAIEWAKRAPLTPGNKLEVRRVTDESDFADYADNEYIEKEKGWREQQAEQSAP